MFFYMCNINQNIYGTSLTASFLILYDKQTNYEKNLHTIIFYHNHKFFNCSNIQSTFLLQKGIHDGDLT